jgi:hypothetical protein
MTVGPVRPAITAMAAGRARRPGGGFALPPAPTDAAGEAGSAAAAVPLGGLLALQESGPRAAPESAEETALRRAGAALDALRALQLELLRGRADPARLEALAALPPQAAENLDPPLAALLGEVRLRARVELARRRLC